MLNISSPKGETGLFDQSVDLERKPLQNDDTQEQEEDCLQKNPDQNIQEHNHILKQQVQIHPEYTTLELIDKVASKFFDHPGQVKRFSLEIQEIFEECTDKKHTLQMARNPLGETWIELDVYQYKIKKISIKTNIEMQVSQETVLINKVMFSLWIGKNYPIKDIRLYCKTSFVKPSLADGRNLIFDVLYGNWSYKNSLVNIVKKLPQFLEKILMYKNDKIYLQGIGQYYLGNFYMIDELKQFHELSRFPAIQMSNAFFQSISVRLICISESHYYLFEFANNSQQETLRLIFRAPLQSCIQLKRKRDSTAEITLTWKNYKTKQEEQHTFKINEYDLFIRVFLRRLNHYSNVRMSSNSYLIFGEQSQEEKSKINQILKSLHELEQQIEKKFNFDYITKLMDLYQSAIEFYSSANDYLQEVYLNKLQTLIQREDVQVILQINKEK